jgi:hypothetical protein
MRKALIYMAFLLMGALSHGAVAQVADTVGIPRDRWIHQDGEFLRQLQPRDSVLIGDQLEYGFRLEGVEDGTYFGFPKLSDGNIELIEDWTQKVEQREDRPRLMDIEASIKVAAFEEGVYNLPPIVVERRSPNGKVDTLFFDPMQVEVKTMPMDTATFKRHPMKGQIQTPFNWDEFVFTMKEFVAALIAMLPLLVALKCVVILLIAGICIWLMSDPKRQMQSQRDVVREPAHIVALRKLDAFRSNAMWVPEKQKEFYTGVTDALREYISRRFGVGAMEMTTAELFDAVKSLEDFPADMQAVLKDLFETADFVKFAKYVASDEDNASAVPKAVRFVTQTYQSDLEKQQAEASEEDEVKK